MTTENMTHTDRPLMREKISSILLNSTDEVSLPRDSQQNEWVIKICDHVAAVIVPRLVSVNLFGGQR